MKRAILAIAMALLVLPAFAQDNDAAQLAVAPDDGLIYLPQEGDVADLERRMVLGELTEDEMAKLGLDPDATKGIGSPIDHLLFTPRSTPCDLYDSRLSTRMVANETRSFDVRGICSVPSDAAAISMTVVAVDAAAKGNFQVWAYNGSAGAAVINFGPGAAYGQYNLINGVNMRLCTSGCTYDLNVKLNFASSSHVLVSVNGWYTPFADHVSIGGASFVSDGFQDPGEYIFSFAGGTLNGVSASACVMAPVSLPEGSSVYWLCGTFLDNTAADATYTLYRKDNFSNTSAEVMAALAPTGASASPRTVCDDTITGPAVDNYAYNYYITTCMRQDHKLYSLRVYFD